VDIAYDPRKNERNIRERGLSFERARDFDFPGAVQRVDTRRDYGERRLVALGYLDRRLHALCYIETVTGIRVISFRRANPREIRGYEKVKVVDR
jgi:uncharacterized DUF497 family protein